MAFVFHSCLCAPLLFRCRCFRAPRRSRKLRSRGRRQQRVSGRASHRRSSTAVAGCLSSVPLRVTFHVRSHASALLHVGLSLLRFRFLRLFFDCPFHGVFAVPVCLSVRLSVSVCVCLFSRRFFSFSCLEGLAGSQRKISSPLQILPTYCRAPTWCG